LPGLLETDELVPEQTTHVEQASWLVGTGFLVGAVAADNKEGLRRCQLAADHGNAFGKALLLIRGKEEEQEEGVRMLLLQAMGDEGGRAVAQHWLGWCSSRGWGVETDLKEAVRWYTLAADQGHSTAQNNLGYCYQHGLGVDTDLKEAVRWYKLAADQGLFAAQTNLGYCYRKGKGVDANQEEAVRWYTLAADQGDSTAQRALTRIS
jgi:hypothetical protein